MPTRHSNEGISQDGSASLANTQLMGTSNCYSAIVDRRFQQTVGKRFSTSFRAQKTASLDKRDSVWASGQPASS